MTQTPSKADFLLPPANGAHLEQFFGVWAIESTAGERLVEIARSTDWVSHISSQTKRERPKIAGNLEADSGDVSFGVVRVNGTLTKYGSSLNGQGSLIEIRRQVGLMAEDPNIDGILLHIDSPGGTVAGTADAGRALAEANRKKPVWAFIEDLGASAAYWLASQAERIVANDRTASVGSIGTLAALYDLSEKAKKEGIEAVVFRSGAMKGAGFPGDKVTPEQRENFQRHIEDVQRSFAEAVVHGRGKSAAWLAPLATGEAFLADEAVQNGLIDEIASIGEVFEQFENRVTRGFAMSTPPSIDRLRAACPGADSDFILRMVEDKASVEDAQRQWIEHLTNERELKEIRPPHGQRIEDGDGDGDSRSRRTRAAGDEFEELVQCKREEGMTRLQAIQSAARENPEAHREHLMQTNPVKVHHLI